MSLALFILAAAARTLPAPAPPTQDTAYERPVHPPSDDPTVLDQFVLPDGGFVVLREGSLSIEHAATAPVTREVPRSATGLVMARFIGVRDGPRMHMFAPLTLADVGTAWDTDRHFVEPRVTTRLLPFGATPSDPSIRGSWAGDTYARPWWAGFDQIVRRDRIDVIGTPAGDTAERRLSPDGRRLARLEGDGTLRLYDTRSGEETCALPRATWRRSGWQHPPTWSEDSRFAWWFSPDGEVAQVDARACVEVFRTTFEPTGERGLVVEDAIRGDWWEARGLRAKTWLNLGTAEIVTMPCAAPLAVSTTHVTCRGPGRHGWPLVVYERGSDSPPRAFGQAGAWPAFSEDGMLAITHDASSLRAYAVATGDLAWERTAAAEAPRLHGDRVVADHAFASHSRIGRALTMVRFHLHLLPRWRAWDVETGHRARPPRDLRRRPREVNDPDAAPVQVVLRADDAAVALVGSRWTWTFDLDRRKVALHRTRDKLDHAFPAPAWIGPPNRGNPREILGEDVTVGMGPWGARTVTRTDGTTLLSAWTATDGSFTAWWDDATVDCKGDVGCIGWWLLPDGTSKPMTDRHHHRWHPRRARLLPDGAY